MKKIFVALILVMSLVFPSLAATSVDCTVNNNVAKITVQGEQNKSVTITISDSKRKYYIDQGITDDQGSAQFNVVLKEGNTYDCSANIEGDKALETFSVGDSGNTTDPEQKDSINISIKGYKGKTILSKTEGEFREGDTVLSVTKRILEEKNIAYDIGSGYIKMIYNEDNREKKDNYPLSGWMYRVNGDYDRYSSTGASDVDINKNDYIEWRYSLDGGYDIGWEKDPNKYGGLGNKQTDIEKAIEDAKSILTNQNASEYAISKAVKAITDKINEKADKITSQADAKDFVNDLKKVASIMGEAVEKIKTEQGVKDLANESVNIVKALLKASEKLNNDSDKKDIDKATAENMKTTLKVMDKVKDIKDVRKIAGDMIEATEQIMDKIGETNSEEIKAKIVEIAEKAVALAGKQKIEKDGLKTEGEKTIAKIDGNKIKDLAKESAKTIKEMKEKLEKNHIENLKGLEKKLTIEIMHTGKEEVETNLPENLMKDLKENGIEKIDIETEIASFSITPKTFGEQGAEKEIALSAKKVDRNDLMPLIRNKIPEGSPIVDLNAKLGQEKTSNFEEAMEIAIPYTGKVEEGKKVKVFFLSDNGTIEEMRGEYDAITKTITFKTNHFSKYFAKQVDKEIKNTFTDLEGYDWAEEAIEAMAAKDIISGRSKGIFDPSANITRAEFATLITKMLNYEGTGEIPFNDVEKEKWYYNAVAAAYKNGLISGRGNTKFDPEGNITRQEMAVMIAKVLEKKGYDKGNLSELDIFKDQSDIEQWAKSGVSFCVKEKIISGIGEGNFAPKENANRAQAAIMLYKLH